MKKKNGKSGKRILKYIFVLLLTLGLLFGLFFLSVYVGLFGALPDKKEFTSIRNEEASLVFSSDNVIIGKYFAQNRTNIKWEDIPDHLKNALIATEDKRFFTHKGYDVISYFRVFVKSILLHNNSGGGGSTLEQQLVKNLYGRKNYGFLTLPVNKIKEIIIASRLGAVYSKEELLLLYLNSVPFGEDIYGVESAARRFFSKPVRNLKIEESAVLVGILKANTYYNPMLNPENALARRNLILSLMEKEKYLSAKEATTLKKLPLKLNYEKGNTSNTGYFVQQVKTRTEELLDSINDATGNNYDLEKDGLRVYTTLNAKVQEFAAKATSNHLAHMQKLLDKELEERRVKKQWLVKQKHLFRDVDKDMKTRPVRLFDWEGIQTQNISKFDSLWHYYKMLHAAVLITDPKNGAVIAWIGGNNFQTLPFDMVLSHRQIASAFKPVLYATALESGIDPCTYLQNTTTKYEGYEDWEPANYTKESTSDSTVALWYALTHSMNLPSVDLYFKVGKENLSNTCEKLKFPGFNDAPSIALGTLDLSLHEVVRAYGAFANRGKMNEMVMIKKITDAQGKILYTSTPAESVQVFDIKTTDTLTAILQQVINQGTGAGIRSRYGIQSQLAGKTGTAQNYTDAWFIAYTPNMVIGTWVGASTPDIHFYSGNGTGASLALPISASILKNMENTPSLRSKYLTPFVFSENVYSFLQCNPYHQVGIKGFFNRLFNRRDKVDNDTSISIPDREENKERGLKSFFKKLFKGKPD
jgi:penicillin-binding protein 1A